MSLDFSDCQNLEAAWQASSQPWGDRLALDDPYTPCRLTYRELGEQAAAWGAGLRALGVAPGDKVALFADNSGRWCVADRGILALGAVDVPRSSQAERQELLYILDHSESRALVLENLKTYRKLQPEIEERNLKAIVLLSDEDPPAGLHNFPQVLALGANRNLGHPDIHRDSPATIIYTSGTSGQPKGVVLTHGNLLYEIGAARTVLKPQPGDRVLSILPTWHAYERTFEYFILTCGCTQIYTNLKNLKKDLKARQPQFMVAVPRLWESIYEAIQAQLREQPVSKQRLVRLFLTVGDRFIKARRTWQGLALNNLEPTLVEKISAVLTGLVTWLPYRLGDRLVFRKIREATGGQLKYVVTGGGSIADALEDFYEVVGIELLGGYGLTETSPITHVRRPQRNLRSGDGQPLPLTETRIVDPETHQELPPGQTGLVWIRGPQVMQGYYRNPEATAKVLNPEGWFNTGDLGWVSAQQDLVITGRAKDTIVLSNGENIEPQPLEDACLASPFIDQIVLVGQDQKHLGALIVLHLPTLVAEGWAAPEEPLAEVSTRLQQDPQAIARLHQELDQAVQNQPGYRPDYRIKAIHLLAEPLSIENGLLTQTFKIRRNAVFERYQAEIRALYP
ncbi:MAG: AMP-dependent synthetase/ligase [Pseudanabaenaceae cyanobacterium]